ncbi:acyl-CoA carboxylase subunit epsilon [Nocardioides sp. YIM 152588]|uniref:acyl-CoA carboxylase subunit epsilon n=1 Tax=Nocardioides sp. YIM 152588 TaxID=3158259 RepID=UPI0032E3A4B6
MVGTEDSAREASPKPFLHVVQPDATPEEIAALVAVFSAIGGGTVEPPAPRSLWASPARRVRTAPGAGIAAGRGAWRASGLPR